MAAHVIGGPRAWEGDGTDDWNRTWGVVYLVQTDDVHDGPAVVQNASGLPAVGSAYALGNDSDVWAYALPGFSVRRAPGYDANEPVTIWEVRIKYGTAPVFSGDARPASLGPRGDPLTEPDRVDSGPKGQASGGSNKRSVEATTDRLGQLIKNSAHETIRGPQTEFDESLPMIRITQNVPALELNVLAGLVNCVNDTEMWGFPKRCVKYSDYDWSIKYYGDGSAAYYERTLVLEVDPKTWDRVIADEGGKVLRGRWARPSDLTGTGTASFNPVWILVDGPDGAPPDPSNPAHFIVATDPKGNPTRLLLDGKGKPALSGVREFYISIDDDNTGNDLTDDEKWAVVTVPPQVSGWKEGSYKVGDVVSDAGEFYVSVSDFLSGTPPALDDTFWKPTGNPDYAGVYDVGTNYPSGQYVQSDELSEPGSIKVEKYHEADLLSGLTLPTSIG